MPIAGMDRMMGNQFIETKAEIAMGQQSLLDDRGEMKA